MDSPGVRLVRRAVCAIGYTKVNPRESIEGAETSFEIVGTGFLAQPRRILTCAHVVDDLEREMKKKRIPVEQRGVQFVYPLESGNWGIAVRPFGEEERFAEPDVAMLTMQGASVPVTPTTIAGADYKPAVGDEIAICGYAHGSILLRRGKTIDRFGPLLLPGWISALSPFDVPRPGLLLLSLVAARCASGSPVFQRETGQVIGVLVEGQEGKGAVVSVARALFVENKGQIMARFGRIRVVERGPAGAGGKGT